jgi:ketoreductase RED2
MRASTLGGIMINLTGKVALITGSSSGIGLAIAKRLSIEGVTVVLNSRSVPDSPIRLPGSDIDALHVAGDVASEVDVAEMVRQVVDRYGALDVLINSAGATVFVDHDNLAGVSLDDWRRILDVNLIGAWNTIRASEKLLRGSSVGVVINITSMAGIRPAGSSIPYSVSKAGLNHMTALLARALGPEIRVNGIAPGFIETPWTQDYNDRREQIIREAPLRRVGLPEDVAETCIGLIRSEYVTGQIVMVDGGLSLL